jgi:DNA-binding PadR family transcriptional regulator
MMHESYLTANSGPEVEVRELGSFELKLLVSIDKLRDEAWGSKLQSELTQLIGRDVAIGQLYLSLSKLERKGLISASLKDPEPVRGGRSKKVFRLEAPGAKALARTAAFLKAPSVLHPKENKYGGIAV